MRFYHIEAAKVQAAPVAIAQKDSLHGLLCLFGKAVRAHLHHNLYPMRKVG